MVASVFSGKYFYEVEDPIVFKGVDEELRFSHPYCRIQKGVLTVKRGYQFNGASPRISFMSLEIGTPQGRGNYTIEAFAVHDALYQFGRKIGLKRSCCDKILLQMLQEKGFPFAKIYYLTVRAFGWKAW
jgi:hypothetical protein